MVFNHQPWFVDVDVIISTWVFVVSYCTCTLITLFFLVFYADLMLLIIWVLFGVVAIGVPIVNCRRKVGGVEIYFEACGYVQSHLPFNKSLDRKPRWKHPQTLQTWKTSQKKLVIWFGMSSMHGCILDGWPSHWRTEAVQQSLWLQQSLFSNRRTVVVNGSSSSRFCGCILLLSWFSCLCVILFVSIAVIAVVIVFLLVMLLCL